LPSDQNPDAIHILLAECQKDSEGVVIAIADDAPKAKVAATLAYARRSFSMIDLNKIAKEWQSKLLSAKAVMVPPYDDFLILAGRVLRPGVSGRSSGSRCLLTPLQWGGLFAGVSTARKH